MQDQRRRSVPPPATYFLHGIEMWHMAVTKGDAVLGTWPVTQDLVPTGKRQVVRAVY